MADYLIDDRQPHRVWDNALPPRARVDPGDTVVFETIEALGRITPESTVADLMPRGPGGHPLTGPVYIEGAEPGDALEIEVVSLTHKGWGWNSVNPNFGLLKGEFPDYYLHHYKLGDVCEFRPDIIIPYEPFCGIMGVAPAEPGEHRTLPPGPHGGNIDIRHLTPGSKLQLPVFVPGALFSCGDCHAAQGDGEVNGTGIEAPMTVALRFNVIKDAHIPEPRFTTPPGKKLTVADEGGYYVTTAHGPDLYQNAQQAIRYMIEHLSTNYDMTPEQAFCLCGAAVDLKLSEVVDAPNWIVSAYLPLSIFK